MEADTPGQINGITLKKDGKSNKSSASENLSSKYTQGADESQKTYTAHDDSAFKEKPLGPRFYFGLGMLIVFVLVYYFSQNITENYVEEERIRSIQQRQRDAKRREEMEQEREMVMQERQRNQPQTEFDSAFRSA